MLIYNYLVSRPALRFRVAHFCCAACSQLFSRENLAKQCIHRPIYHYILLHTWSRAFLCRCLQFLKESVNWPEEENLLMDVWWWDGSFAHKIQQRNSSTNSAEIKLLMHVNSWVSPKGGAFLKSRALTPAVGRRFRKPTCRASWTMVPLFGTPGLIPTLICAIRLLHANLLTLFRIFNTTVTNCKRCFSYSGCYMDL